MAADWSDPSHPTYSIASDTANGTVDHILLREEMDLVDIGGRECIGSDEAGDVLTLHFDGVVGGAKRPNVDAAVLAHDGEEFIARHLEEKYDRGLRQSTTWYSSESGGVFSGKIEDWVYTYSGDKLVSEVHKTYDSGGGTITTESFTYAQATDGTIKYLRRTLS